MPSIGPRSSQQADKDRPFWIWIRQGSLDGGGDFGGSGGWTRVDNGQPTGLIDLNKPTGRQQQRRRCIQNCSGGFGSEGPEPIYETRSETTQEPIPDNGGREPSVEAFVPAGLPGNTGAIVSLFPPLTVDISCQQSPLRIEGGQQDTLYDLTLRVNGRILDNNTNELLMPFSADKVVRAPGPIIGYTASQYAYDAGKRDIKLDVFFSDENNNIGNVSREMFLSMQTLAGGLNNMTLEGDNYYFDVESVVLENLVRADAQPDGCSNTACFAEVEIELESTDNIGVYYKITRTVDPPVPWIIKRVAPTTDRFTTGGQVIVYGEDEVNEQQLVFQAFAGDGFFLPGERIRSAAFISIDCDHTVNAQLPGCFIETPETCNVTIRDQSGILFDQTYFGRPEVEVSDTYSVNT